MLVTPTQSPNGYPQGRNYAPNNGVAPYGDVRYPQIPVKRQKNPGLQLGDFPSGISPIVGASATYLQSSPNAPTAEEKYCWKTGAKVQQQWGTLLVYANNDGHTDYSTGFGKRIGALKEIPEKGISVIDIGSDAQSPSKSNWVYQDPSTGKVYLIYYSGLDGSGNPNLTMPGVKYYDIWRRITEVYELIPCSASVSPQNDTGDSIIAGNNQTATATGCPPCPSNCKVEQRQMTYYAHPQRTSDKDIPIQMQVTKVVCKDVARPPRIKCEEALKDYKAAHGLSGIGRVGCAACRGNHEDRM